MTHQTVFRVFLFVTLLSSLHSFASRSFAQTKHAPVRQSTGESGPIHGVGGEEPGRQLLRPLDPLAVPVFSVAPGKAATIFFWCVEHWDTLAGTVSFGAIASSPPPNYVDDGNLIPSAFQLKPGQTLGGFSFRSPYGPNRINFIAQPFKLLPAVPADDSVEGFLR